MKTAMRSLFSFAIVTFAAIAMVACGGGGSNGNQGGAAGFLQLASQPAYGVMGTVNGTTPFNVSTPSAVSQVGPSNFASAPVNDANFLEFNFSTTVSETSLQTGGLTVRNSNGDPLSFFLDKAGAIDPTNAFMGDEAPALTRVYFQDAMNPGVPIRLPADGYSVRLSPPNLRSGAGIGFCSIEEGGSCVNLGDVVYTFTLDGQTSPVPGTPTPFGFDPSLTPLPLPSTQGINTGAEIRLFFNREVDFQSIVGFNGATGMANTTTQDPFCSVPFPMGGGAGSNISITYTPPANTVLPPNYGFIVYMPNPFLDAREVRIRFIDITLAVPFDDPMGAFSANGLPTNQNYAIPSAVWNNRPPGVPFGTPTDTSAMQNGPLELPAVLPLPGSTPGNAIPDASIVVNLLGPTTGSDSSLGSAMPDGVNGVTDRGRRPIADPAMVMGNLVVTRNLRTGPRLANNPEPPDLHIVAAGNVLTGYDAAGNTVGANLGVVSGNLFPLLTPIDDPTALTSPVDAMFGAFLNPANNTGNPPRRNNNAQVIALGLQAIANGMPETAVGPGTPFPPGGTPENSFAMPPLPQQPLGARLYVVDASANEVKVFNSNTFQPLGVIQGIATPRGLGTDGSFFYVTEFSQDTVARFGAIPGTPLFHQFVNRTSVGSGPTSVSVQPGLEDIVCINELDRSMSFVDLPTFAERFQIPTGMGPSEIAVSGRWTGPGTTSAYMAYSTNTFSNTVTIYESDSPLLTVPNGPEGKLLENKTGFTSPTNGIWTLTLGPTMNVGAQGMYVPNSQGNSVTYLAWTFFNLAPTPGFQGPPPIRTYTNILDYVGTGLNGGPTDVCIDTTILTLAQAATSLHAMFPGSGQVASFNATNALLLGTANVPGNQIFTSADQ